MVSVGIKNQWENDLPSEVSFWEDWIRFKGLHWKKDYKARLDSNSRLQNFFKKYLNKTIPKNKILDVGAGPLTKINKKCNLTKLEIYPIDPLADEYNMLLKKYGIKPLIKTKRLEGEKLTEKYNINTFDITNSRNAIDHAYDPLKVIEEMIKVTKRGGYIILQVAIKEGSYHDWEGLHNWDFFLKDDALFLKGNGTPEFNISELFKNVVKLVEVSVKNRWLRENKWLVMVLKKL